MADFKKNRLKLTYVITFILLFSVMSISSGFAQVSNTGTIKGKVIEKSNQRPMFMTNVSLLNTRLGAATDFDGNYVVTNVPVGTYRVQVSYVSYKTEVQEVTVTAGREVMVNFEMEDDILALDEVVVTGQGYALKKKELTTTIQTINPRDIEEAPVESIEHLLAGRITGGQIKVKTGQPGTGATMRLRGVTSATASQTPVIYIDGVRVDNSSGFDAGLGGVSSSALSDIHIDDVERVEIIKSGAASTFYGSEAAAGVIQIFTKKGQGGAAKWKYRMEQGVNSPEEKFVYEQLVKDGILRTGYFQKHSINVSGGNEKVTYNISGSVKEDEGSMRKNYSRTYAFNTGIRTFLTDRIQVNVTARASKDMYQRIASNNALEGPQVAVEVLDWPFWEDDADYSYADKLDRLDLYFLPNNDHFVWRYGFSTTTTFEQTDNIRHMLTLGNDYRKSEQRVFHPIAAEDVATSGGGLFRDDREFSTITLDYKGTLRYPTEGNFTNAITLGAQGFREDIRNLNAEGVEFGLPGSDDFDNAANIDASEFNASVFSGGFVLSDQMGFMDKYFLNLTYRIDGNSTFGEGTEFEGYKAGSFAYNISDEDFWSTMPMDLGTKWINTMKLRVAYGETGMFPAAFQRDRTFSQTSFRDQVAADFSNPGNDDLGPERTSTVEFGFDAAFWNSRIGFELTRVLEETTEALMSVPRDPSTGLGTQLENVGTIENKIWEFRVDATVWNSEKVNVNFNAGFSTLHNEVTDMGSIEDFGLGFGRVTVGKPVGIARTNKPVSDGAGGYTGEYNEVYELQTTPDKLFNIGLKVGIGTNFDFSIFGDGQRGSYVRNQGALYRYYAAASDEELYPQISEDLAFNGGWVPEGYNSSRASIVFWEKADFFKIREIAAVYRMPKEFYGAKFAFNASVRNPWIFAGNRTIDPELNGFGSGGEVGVGAGSAAVLSQARQWRFGVQVEF